MRSGIAIGLSDGDRRRLQAIAGKRRDIVLLYVSHPDRAAAFGIDENNRIKAPNRIQSAHPPSLPINQGTRRNHASRLQATRDYKRNGTPALLAALNGPDGSATGQTRQHRRHREFIRFPNAIARRIPANKEIHAIPDAIVAAVNRGLQTLESNR